jgi:hypothetical protein
MKTEQQQKNQRIILVIFAMSFIPFLVAWYLKENPELLVARTNHGQLIPPPVTTQLVDFAGVDQFSRENMTELTGHWVLVNVIPGSECKDACLEAMHKTKQLILMMNKDLTRMRRVVVLLNDIDPTVASVWWRDDSRLLRAKANATLTQGIRSIGITTVPDGLLLIMDPLGNLMMHYAPGFDPYKVKDDLKKLLNVSQIG